MTSTNIRRIISLLHEEGYNGHLSIVCEGQGGPMLTRSQHWLRNTITELGIPEEKS